MIIVEHHIEYKYGDIIKIKPIFDVHMGNRHCDVKGFKKFLQDDDDPQTYFIGGGDLLDSIVVTDKRYRKTEDGTTGDDIVDEQIAEMLKCLLPYKERILGLGTGNHEDVITNRCGTNPIKRLCKELEVPFLGYSCFFRVRMSENGGRCRQVVIKQHHGWGGGSRTRGANITKYERDLGKWDADIFLYGHVHQKQYDRMPRLGISGMTLVSRPQLMAICGTFLKTLSDTSDPTYSELKGFPPTEIGGITIKIKPTRQSYELWAEG